MSYNRFADPIIPTWYTDSDGNKISKIVRNETLTIVENRAPLNGLPDEFHRVRIDGMVEIDINSEIKDPKQFKVDYAQTGNVFFHSSLNGQDILVNEYASRGVSYYPASRIYYDTDESGNINLTLGDAILLLKDIDEITKIVEEMEENIFNLNNEISENMEDGTELVGNLKEQILIGNETYESLTTIVSESVEVKEDLEEIFSNSKVMKEEAQGMMEQLSEMVDNSESIIQRGENAVEYLTLNLDKADAINESLKVLIPAGEELDESLRELIQMADERNAELKTTIQNSEQAKELLQEKIDEANALLILINPLLEQLAEVVESADIVLNLLRDQTVLSQETYDKLMIAIEDGQGIIDEIENIIGGTDFDEVIKRLDKLEKRIIVSEIEPTKPNLHDFWVRT